MALITDCRRVSPPPTNCTRSPGACLMVVRSGSGIATTTRATSVMRNRSTTYCTSGFPASGWNCLGMGPPKRVPEPAAGMMTRTPTSSDRHDVLFFVFENPADFFDVFVGHLLDLVQRALLVILGDLVALHHLFQPVVAVPTDLADRGPRLFRDVMRAFDQLLAA